VPFPNNLRWWNALNHKLEVGEQCSVASYYTLITVVVDMAPGLQNISSFIGSMVTVIGCHLRDLGFKPSSDL